MCATAHLPGAPHNACPTPGCKLWCDATCTCPDCPECAPGRACADCSEDGTCWSCHPETRRELRPTPAAERARAAACVAAGADPGPAAQGSAEGSWARAQRAKDAEDRLVWAAYR